MVADSNTTGAAPCNYSGNYPGKVAEIAFLLGFLPARPDEPSLTVGLVLKKIASDALGMESDTSGIASDASGITSDASGIESVTLGMESDADGIRFDTVGIDPDAGGIVFETRNQPLPMTKRPKIIAYLVTTGYPGGKSAFRTDKVICVTLRSP